MQRMNNRWQYEPIRKSTIITGDNVDPLCMDQRRRDEYVNSSVSQRHFGQNTTITSTYNNSMAKNEKISRSFIKISGLKQDSTNKSLSRRKKFISVTQKDTDRKRELGSNNYSMSERQKSSSKCLNAKEKSYISTSRLQQSFQTEIKNYVSGVIKNISQFNVENYNSEQQKIMDEQNFLQKRQFSRAEKAKQERNFMAVLFQKQKRSYTEISDQFKVQNKKIITQSSQVFWENDKPIRSIETVDRPNRKFLFHQKIGSQTLTRNDSFIIGLMQLLEDSQKQDQQKGKVKRSIGKSQEQHKMNKEGQHSGVQKYTISKLGRKSKNEDKKTQIQAKDINATIDGLQKCEEQKSKGKKQRIKFLSLIQKQQSQRYKNISKDNQQIKQQFSTMKNRASKLKQNIHQ